MDFGCQKILIVVVAAVLVKSCYQQLVSRRPGMQLLTRLESFEHLLSLALDNCHAGLSRASCGLFSGWLHPLVLNVCNTIQSEYLCSNIQFIGDIHQPLHDENLDIGGNDIDVTFDGTSTNLHAVVRSSSNPSSDQLLIRN